MMSYLAFLILVHAVKICIATRQAHGFDVSGDAHGPRELVHGAEAASDFVFYRATYGRQRDDYTYNFGALRAASRNMPVGAIHLATVEEYAGDDDAQYLWTTVRTIHPNGAVMLPAALQLEYAPSRNPVPPGATPQQLVQYESCHGVPPSTFRNYIFDFVSTWTWLAGYPPILKTSLEFFKLCVEGDGQSESRIGMCPLWIIHPTHPSMLATTVPELPTPWNSRTWTFWQYGNVGEDAGHRSLFFSDAEDLRQYASQPNSLGWLHARRDQICSRRSSSCSASSSTNSTAGSSAGSSAYRSDSERSELKAA